MNEKLEEKIGQGIERIIRNQVSMDNLGIYNFYTACQLAKESGEFEELYVTSVAGTDTGHHIGFRKLELVDRKPSWVTRNYLATKHPDKKDDLPVVLAGATINPFCNPLSHDGKSWDQGIVAEIVQTDKPDYLGTPMGVVYKLK